MLEDTSKPAFSGHTLGLATYILPLDHNFGGASNILADITRNAQAALAAQLLTLGLDNLRVEEGHLTILILGDEDADGLRYLWCGQANPIGGVHSLKHIIDQLLQRWVKAMDLFCLLA